MSRVFTPFVVLAFAALALAGGAEMTSADDVPEPELPPWTEDLTLLQSQALEDPEREEADYAGPTALSGDTILLGVPGSNRPSSDSGSALVFTRTGMDWSLEQRLVPSDGSVGDHFGASVAIDGDTAVVVAPDTADRRGAAYVFERDGSTWTETQKLLASDAAASAGFVAAALEGDTLLIGASGRPFEGNVVDAGGVYVFSRVDGGWQETQTLTASDAFRDARFGSSVALSGDRAVVGAFRADGVGAAYVFERANGLWNETKKLPAPSDVVGGFGTSVGLHDDVIAVGAEPLDGMGAVAMHVATSGDWAHVQTLRSLEGKSDFGVALAMDGEMLVVGEYSSNAAYVFGRIADSWVRQVRLTKSNGAGNDQFARFVALQGQTALVGAPRVEDTRGRLNTGAVFVFELDADMDGVLPDNCPMIANPDQADNDGDRIGDSCDDVDNDAPNHNEGGCRTASGPTSGLFFGLGWLLVLTRVRSSWTASCRPGKRPRRR